MCPLAATAAFSADYDTGAFSASYGGEIHESDDAISYDYDTAAFSASYGNVSAGDDAASPPITTRRVLR